MRYSGCTGALIVLGYRLFATAFLTPSTAGPTSLRGDTRRAASSAAFQIPITARSRQHVNNVSSWRVSSAASAETEEQLRARPVLSFPGGGIFFWWQAGVISALQERYDLSSVDFVGASAGSLAATLAACDADMDLAMTLALDLCETNDVWSRPLGLAGVWGAMVEDWLDDLLPDDADVICRDRVYLLVLGMWPRPFRRIAIADFTSKEDLIKSCMASVHIPYFMNKKFTARLRGRRFVDGSFRASREALSLGSERPTVYFDYEDDEIMGKRRGKILSLTNKEGLLFMRNRGYEHVQVMVEEGKLDCIEYAALPSRRSPASADSRESK